VKREARLIGRDGDNNMDDEPTCGKGIAANAPLRARLAEWMTASAGIFRGHQAALDPNEPNGRLELDAYQRLAEAHRQIASALAAVAEQMAGYRDLPMAEHDMQAMTDPRRAEEFERYLHAEQDLLALLQSNLKTDLEMLRQMQGKNTPGWGRGCL
jgi:hypothetical protein